MSDSVWGRAMRSPQFLLALLVLILAMVAIIATTEDPPEIIEYALPVIEEETLLPEEVRLVTFDQFSLEIPLRVSVEVPRNPTGRLRVIVGALVATLDLQGIWPAGLELPDVFLVDMDGSATAVLDFRPPEDLDFSQEAERRLLRSIEETMLAAGADTVRFLRQGESDGVFLQNVPVPRSL